MMQDEAQALWLACNVFVCSNCFRLLTLHVYQCLTAPNIRSIVHCRALISNYSTKISRLAGEGLVSH